MVGEKCKVCKERVPARRRGTGFCANMCERTEKDIEELDRKDEAHALLREVPTAEDGGDE